MRSMTKILIGFVLICGAGVATAQDAANKTAEAAPVERVDPGVDAASQWINRALFLRCLCAENTLSFDAQGHPQGVVKTTDWTLAGVNVQKAMRKGPGEIELDGVRVAIRYATDRHEFDRHPQNDDKMHLTFADTGDGKALERALEAAFATGIDRSLQLSLADYWQHYFDPGMAWPPDALSGETIYTFETPAAAAKFNKTASVAEVTHKADPSYTGVAARDHVTGSVKVHMVVDPEGVPRRLAVVQPLGYGLDAKAAEAAAKYRFTAASLKGKPVASNVLLNQDFVVVVAPQ